MPRLMSFALTTKQVRERTKTVTRRRGWAKLKAGDRLTAVVKAMGLAKGEKVERLAEIVVEAVTLEPLDAITADDVAREGFPEMSPAEFVAMFCGNMGGKPDQMVRRIQFRYAEGGE